MNILKRCVLFVWVLLMISGSIYADGEKNYSIKTTINYNTGEIVSTEESLRENVDFSEMDVIVFEDYMEKELIRFRIIYEGKLGEYDGGLWNDIDFDKIDFLQIVNSEYNKIRYILPASKYNPDNAVVEKNDKSIVSSEKYNTTSSLSGLVVSSEITLNGVKVNENGMRIVDNANMVCRLNVENNSANEDELVVIFATYTSDGILYNINSFKSDISGNESKNIEFEYHFDAENEHNGKIMIWNSLTKMTPLRATVDFSQTSGICAYYYNADNRLLQIDKANGKSLIFTYDNMGNLLSKTIRE